MKKSRYVENAVKNARLLKEVLSLSEDDYLKVFGIQKNDGIGHIVDAIIKDLEK